MRSSCGIAVVLAVTALAIACGGDGIAPSNTPPAADFASACALLACTFADASSDADGEITAYAWDFGDGAASRGSKDAQHTYAVADGYTVTLTVTDNDGAANSVRHSVQANTPPNLAPSASFTGSCTYLACSFSNLSSDADGTLVAYQWDFGDGGLAATADASHTFASAGAYDVALIVTDDAGATGKLSQQVRVADAPSPVIGIVAIAQILTNLCYPARAYSTRGCPSGASASISNTGGGTLNWTSTSSAPWLKRSPSSGTAPTAMRIWVDGKDLPQGSYSGQITIMAAEATNSPRSISVHVTRD